MQTGRARLALLLIATAAAARVVLFGILDRRPLYGGWEGSDLQRSMFYHYGLRGHLDWTFAEQVTRDGFKPPLWFGGVPALFGWKPSLSALDYLLVNAAAMGGAVVIAFALGKRLGGARGGLCAAALTAFLPGVAWRIGMVGVEPTHMVLLPAAVLALLALLHEAEHRSLKTAAPVGVVLGVLAGAGLLLKWNFGVYLVAPALVTLGLGLAAPVATIGALLLAAAVAAALFGAWVVPFADLAEITASGVQGEVSDVGPAVFLAALREGFGPAGFGLVGLAGLGLVAGEPPRDRGLRPRRAALVIAVTVLALLAVHAVIPHKESRYLLPAFPLLAALLGGPLGRIASVREGAWVAGGTLVALAALSWVAPWSAPTRDQFAWKEVVPAPVADDFDLERLVTHPSLRDRDRTVVTFALAGEGRWVLLTFLQWELYGRNANPVLSRSDWDDVTSRACAFDLERSTHFVAGRALDDQEEAALRSMGFEVVIRVQPRIDDVPELALWALDPASAPRYR